MRAERGTRSNDRANGSLIGSSRVRGLGHIESIWSVAEMEEQQAESRSDSQLVEGEEERKSKRYIASATECNFGSTKEPSESSDLWCYIPRMKIESFSCTRWD